MNKTTSFLVRCTPDQNEQLKAAAKAAGLSLSAYMLSLALRESAKR